MVPCRLGAPHLADLVSARFHTFAYSRVVPVNKDELLALQKEFNKLAKKNESNDHTISRAQFQEALHLVGIEESGAWTQPPRSRVLHDLDQRPPRHSHPAHVCFFHAAWCVAWPCVCLLLAWWGRQGDP